MGGGGGGTGGGGTGTGTMSCALVPFGHFQDLEAARDFLCPHRRPGSVAAGKEGGESAPRFRGAGGPLWPGPARPSGATVRASLVGLFPAAEQPGDGGLSRRCAPLPGGR